VGSRHKQAGLFLGIASSSDVRGDTTDLLTPKAVTTSGQLFFYATQAGNMADTKAAAPAEEVEVDSHRGELVDTYVEVVTTRGGMKRKLTSRAVFVGDITTWTSAVRR
jgi:hypothetical protein